MPCLQTINEVDGINIILACRREIEGLNQTRKRKYLVDKIRTLAKGITPWGYLSVAWKLGCGVEKSLDGVCRSCFAGVYDVGDTSLTAYCAEVKKNIKNGDGDLNDRSNSFAYDAEFQRAFARLAKTRGRKLSHTQIAAIQIANTSTALATYSWMDYFFKLVGDFIPNSNDEIHLEPITIQEIHDEYVIDMEHQGDESLGYEAFLRMWNSCFPYVKIREYKQVTGKIHTRS